MFLPFNVFFLLYMFSFLLFLLFLLSLVQYVPSCSFLCFLCWTGSSFQTIPVSLGEYFGIFSPFNQCLSHLNVRRSQNFTEELFISVVAKELTILPAFLNIYSPAVCHSSDDLIDSECQR